jgi:hypothetical protein
MCLSFKRIIHITFSQKKKKKYSKVKLHRPTRSFNLEILKVKLHRPTQSFNLRILRVELYRPNTIF